MAGSVCCSHLHCKHIQTISRSPDHLKVVLEDSDRSRKSFMSTSTEERHSSIQQDGGNQGWIRDAS